MEGEKRREKRERRVLDRARVLSGKFAQGIDGP